MLAIRQEQARIEETRARMPRSIVTLIRLSCRAIQKSPFILGWVYDSKLGLVLHGAIGRGKTRLAYLLVRRLVLDGRSVSA